jgi:acetyltransferase-like isoleucine patch superfamily enzyme
MSILRKLYYLFLAIPNWFIFRLNSVKCHGRVQVNGIATIYNRGKIQIGSGARINSGKFKNMIGGDTRTSIVVTPNGTLTIGDNLSMSNSAIVCANGITIGDNVMIGGSCKIWDTDFHPIDPVMRKADPNKNYKTRPIVIKNNAFIGGCSIILKGVTIGENAIVGAGSVVRSDIPANEIWAGNPAQFIKRIEGLDNK